MVSDSLSEKSNVINANPSYKLKVIDQSSGCQRISLHQMETYHIKAQTETT